MSVLVFFPKENILQNLPRWDTLEESLVLEDRSMTNLFSPDSLPMRFMSRVADLLILNLLFLLSCVPVVTVGAALQAMYRVCFQLDTEQEQGLLKTYFGAFRENFGRSTGLWLILLACGTATAVNTCLFYVLPGPLHYCFVLFATMLLLVLLTGSFVFPLLSRFESPWKATLKNGMFLSIGYLPRALLITALNIAPFACMLLNFYLFLQLGFLWASIYFAFAAYINTLLLKKVFAPYLEEETHDHA